MNIKQLISKLIELRTNDYDPTIASFFKSLPDSVIIGGILEHKNNNGGPYLLNKLIKECEHIREIKTRTLREIITEFNKKNPDYKDGDGFKFPYPRSQKSKHYLGKMEISLFEYRILWDYHLYLEAKRKLDELKPHLERSRQANDIKYYEYLKKEHEEYDEKLKNASHKYKDTYLTYHRIVDLAKNILKYINDFKEYSSVCDESRIKSITKLFNKIGVTHYEDEWNDFLNLRESNKYENWDQKVLIAYCCDKFRESGVVTVDNDWFIRICKLLDITNNNYKKNKRRSVSIEKDKTINEFINNQLK